MYKSCDNNEKVKYLPIITATATTTTTTNSNNIEQQSCSPKLDNKHQIMNIVILIVI